MHAVTVQKYPALPILFLALLFLFPPVLEAKNGVMTENQALYHALPAGNKIDAAFVARFEARMRPVLEAKIKGKGALLAAPQLQESDVLMLPRLWDRLSPSFMTLYFDAIQIPEGYLLYVSPGGHFEVFYTTTDTFARVDKTDTMGFGNSGNWRTKSSGGNGIPDYVDAVAWACDSSWSLHVDRHQFVAPLAFTTGRYASKRYKVVITALGALDYGYTYPMGKRPDSARGYMSLFQIRNSWKGSRWTELGYQENPVDGIRVTCAHELFHSVQYAMTWNTPLGNDLDNFPLTFIEGTAVLMEEIAFDYINDYLQYATAFFRNPGMSFFNAWDEGSAYSNSFLAKFIYEKSDSAPDISFFRRIFFTNFAAVTSYHPNLRSSSLASGAPWTILLNRFHTGSFYTGNRADTARFIADAGLVGQWSFQIDTLPASYAVTKTANPYGMQIFAFSNDGSRGDTLFMAAQGQTGGTGTSPLWAVSCIARGKVRTDSLFIVPIDQSGKGWCRLDDWSSWREIVVLATNGHSADRLDMTLSLLSCPVNISSGTVKKIDRDAADGSGSASLSLVAKNDLRCDLEMSEAIGPVPAVPSTIIPVSAFWSLTFPLFWGSDAELSLTLNTALARVDSLRKNYYIPDDSIALCYWEASANSWEKVASTSQAAAGYVSRQSAGVLPGIYGLFASKISQPDSSDLLAVKNTGRLASRSYIRFKAADIREIRIYGSNGSFICRYGPVPTPAFQPDREFLNAVEWKLTNDRGKAVAPGTYLAYITRKDPLSERTIATRVKVMVFP
jgi:hypothetical protein